MAAEAAFLQSLEDEQPTPSAPQPSTPKPSSEQPKTIGGFILDDDEDDEDPPMEAAQRPSSAGIVNVDRGSSKTPQRSLPKSPNNAVSANGMLSPSSAAAAAAKDQDLSSSSSPNGITDSVPNLAAVLPKTGAPSEDLAVAAPSLTLPAPPQVANASISSLPRARLPHDTIGILEDRIKEDPKGDVDAWLSLISEHRKHNKIDEVRQTYDRFFAMFPTAGEQMVDYARMELDNNDFSHLEGIFQKHLESVPNVKLWSLYLDYVRRRYNLHTDTTGEARRTVQATFDFVLNTIGIDKDSGKVWQDYIQFIKDRPGRIGGNSWEDQQKMDQLRKTYQRAISVPTNAAVALWSEYDSFERGLNQEMARKLLQEKSPSAIQARAAYTQLQNLTQELDRTSVPSLAPLPGFDGDAEYKKQVEIWKSWIEWEKRDPVVLKDDEFAEYRQRILYAYKQATMSLRFWPEMWSEAADFCFEQNLESEGVNFLKQGIEANPESVLLAFKYADHIESTTTHEEGEDNLKRRGEAVREPYNKVLDSLYGLLTQVTQQEAQAIARIRANTPVKESRSRESSPDPTAHEGNNENPDLAQKVQIEALQRGNVARVELLTRTISHVWIALMRAMRRVQGQGKVGGAVEGFRGILKEARRRGRINWEVWMASGFMEHHCYKDPSGRRIFEKTIKLYPDQPECCLQFLKFLVGINDLTNARAVFETYVQKLLEKEEHKAKTKPLFLYFHEIESSYGELSQIRGLEKRMHELFPEDPDLSLFSKRYSSPSFDPLAVRLIVSTSRQARPKAFPSVEKAASVQNSPRPPFGSPQPTPASHFSPKRPLEDSDSESLQPRKAARAESPLKGAAGRRLDAAKRGTQLRNEVTQNGGPVMPPPAAVQPTLPRDVMFLLSIIPRAELYNATRLNPERMVNLLRSVDMSKANTRQAAQSAAPVSTPQYGYSLPAPSYGYGH